MPDRFTIFRQPHWSYPRDVPQVGAQIIGIGAANSGLLYEFIELLAQNYRLGLGHAVIVSPSEEAVALEATAGVAAVVIRAAFVDQIITHPGNSTALSGGNMF